MHDSILETVGSPLVRLSSPPGTTVAAKVESFNPSGSVKVRPAREMIAAAERAGDIESGDTLVEATSGNTGIGLALAAAAKGYDLEIVMPDSVSTERRALIRAYGATVELVEDGMEAANARAREIADSAGAYLISQFENPANPAAHERTTAPEIREQIGDREIDAFVATVGTGGTISGTARGLLDTYPDMTVVGVEPAANPFLSTGQFAEHDYQGMGPDFLPETLDRSVIDVVESVALEDAEAACRRLAAEEGILAGQSSGAAVIAARRIAERYASSETAPDEAEGPASDETAPPGDDSEYVVVTLLPDTGERYLSTGLFG